jgi:hypothetical protein
MVGYPFLDDSFIRNPMPVVPKTLTAARHSFIRGVYSAIPATSLPHGVFSVGMSSPETPGSSSAAYLYPVPSPTTLAFAHVGNVSALPTPHFHKRQLKAASTLGSSICQPKGIGKPATEISNFPESRTVTHSDGDIFSKRDWIRDGHVIGPTRLASSWNCRLRRLSGNSGQRGRAVSCYSAAIAA